MKSIRKKVITLSLIIAALSANPMGGYAVEAESVNIIIDGENQIYDVEPVIVNGRTMVPMRGIFETLGASLEWNSESRTAKAIKDTVQVSVEIGSSIATKNDIVLGEQFIRLDAEPIIEEGRTLVPLRFISESFGANVDWLDDTRTVVINTPGYQNKQDQIQINNKESNRTVLTYDGALELALKNSYDLKDLELQLEKAEDQYDNTYLTPGTYNPNTIKSKKSLEVSKEWVEKQLEIKKESIEFEIENAINDLAILKKELEVTNFQIENNEENLRIAKLKAENGMQSDYDLSVELDNQDQLLKEKKSLEISIDNAYLNLNKLLGKEENERYEVEANITYSPLDSLDIDDRVRKELSTNPNIWYLEKQIYLADLDLKLYEYNSGGSSYRVTEINVASTKNSLKQTKESLENSLRSMYNQVKQLEENYDKLNIQLDTANKTLNVTRKQLEVGMAINLDVKKAELAVEQLEYNIDNVKVQHEQLVKTLYKPYIGSASSSQK